LIYNPAMIRLLLIVVALFGTHALAADSKPEITGAARIVDGDTPHLNGTKIRLHGIDAPETKQACQHQDGSDYRCGEASTEALRALVGSQPVRCEGSTHDRYGRLIDVCYANGIELNAEMVRQGWALAYRRYSKDYVSVEMEAQEANRGMWAGGFDKPWEWRRLGEREEMKRILAALVLSVSLFVASGGGGQV
jgi:endonuclease YncB( thermonuclease family)